MQVRIPCKEERTLPEATPVPLCQKQKTRPNTRERGEAGNLRRPAYTLASLPRSPTSGSAASEPPCAEYHLMKRPGEKNHRAAAEADRPARGGREATGPEEEEGPRPTPSLARGMHTQSSPEMKTTESGTPPPPPPPLQSRPDEPRMTNTHPEDGPETRSQEPNCSNSFNRDRIARI